MTSPEPPSKQGTPTANGPRERVSYDRIIKVALSGFLTELATWLVGKQPERIEELGSGLVAAEERYADKLLWLRFRGRSDMMLHVEFQIEGRQDMPERMAQYLALIVRTKAFKERQAQPACVVVYLDKRTYRQDPGQLDVVGDLETRLFVSYRVVKLWEEDPRQVFELETPGLCVFAPLFRGDRPALLVQSQQKIESSGLPMGVKRDLLGVLAGLASRVIQDQSLLGQLVSEIRRMGDNYVFELIHEEGMALGLEKGRQKGLKVGLAQGAVTEARRMLLRTLARRFGAVSLDLRKAVEQLGALDRLEALQDEAVSCASLNAFRSVLVRRARPKRGR